MEENHDEQHFTERELAGSHAFAMRWDQLFPLAIFEDLCKISDTAKQGDDRRVHEGRILSVGFDFGTDTKSGSAQFWNTHQPAYPELGLLTLFRELHAKVRKWRSELGKCRAGSG